MTKRPDDEDAQESQVHQVLRATLGLVGLLHHEAKSVATTVDCPLTKSVLSRVAHFYTFPFARTR